LRIVIRGLSFVPASEGKSRHPATGLQIGATAIWSRAVGRVLVTSPRDARGSERTRSRSGSLSHSAHCTNLPNAR
jgi:hypothetical protein